MNMANAVIAMAAASDSGQLGRRRTRDAWVGCSTYVPFPLSVVCGRPHGAVRRPDYLSARVRHG
jgi:hypothetical protein